MEEEEERMNAFSSSSISEKKVVVSMSSSILYPKLTTMTPQTCPRFTHTTSSILCCRTESAPCFMCLHKMSLLTQPLNNENSWRKNRLRNELRSLRSDPPEGIQACPLDELSVHWQASIRGPAGSPYEGGTFFLYIQIPHSYPLCPPIVCFITKIFHPNVSRHGDIGIDSIQHNWSLALTISKVLISIQSLLTDPYTKVGWWWWWGWW
ncbi:Ubiquitin-conjugating enzyme E2 8 [Portunus trituberculatus]|uniref:Ubiquitin-conjugating enzyme E2 8 n=1 Tax=Portunus trituberculatus TaxID=210409 RepID=A0A5B7HBA7_PORTR|nr:Ubiquitin-conjugating enzyme E2 8 [Portunus trituberculatus]